MRLFAEVVPEESETVKLKVRLPETVGVPEKTPAEVIVAHGGASLPRAKE